MERHIRHAARLPPDRRFRRVSNSDSGGTSGPRAAAASPEIHDDGALVLAIATRRDRAAFVVLFDRFAPRLKSWFLRGGTSTQHAEDLVQETMLAVWRKAASFDPARAGAATWIFTIARNQRIDALRRSARQVLDDEDPSLAPAAPTAPDAALDALQRETRLRAAMATLTAEQIDVIRLSFFEDRPHAEIERVLGIPLGTVKSRLRLAMNRLRAHLGEYRPAQPDARANGEQL
jgi:RNA polymerase sigma-70 factor (ECF subfamily)